MNEIKLKLRYIYLPFLYVSLGTVAGYSLFNFCFFDTGLIQVSDMWAVGLLPPITVLITHLIVVYRRIKFLNLKRQQGRDWYEFYLIMACLVTITPAYIFQSYIMEIVGELVVIDDVSQIDQKHPAKFYRIKRYHLDTSNAVPNCVTNVTGKHNEYLNFTEYVATPIYPQKRTNLWDSLHMMQSPDSGLVIVNWKVSTHAALAAIPDVQIAYRVDLNGWDGGFLFREAGRKGVIIVSTEDKSGYTYDIAKLGYRRPVIWMGWNETETFSNGISEKEKHGLWEHFIRRKQKQFESETFKGITYFKRLSFGEDLTNFNACILNQDKWAPGLQRIYMPCYNKFEDRKGDRLALGIATFLIGQFIWLLMLLPPSLNLGKLGHLKKLDAKF